MIELHAQFLELNFLSQIRVIPNVSCTVRDGVNHPLTLHISPTSHVNVIATSITPQPSSSSKFVLIAPDSEVIITPKTRQRSDNSNIQQNKTDFSAGRPSSGGRSAKSSTRQKREHTESHQEPFFARIVDRSVVGQWFDAGECDEDKGVKVWLGREALSTRQFRSAKTVAISIVRPSGLGVSSTNQSTLEGITFSSIIVANLGIWENAPNRNHACLSSLLCQILGCPQVTGEIARIETAVQPGLKNSESERKYLTQSIQIQPFSPHISNTKGVLSFGNKQTRRDKSLQSIRESFGNFEARHKILHGPLTHGMILPSSENHGVIWPGGILRIKDASNKVRFSELQPIWILEEEQQVGVDFQPEIPSQPRPPMTWRIGEPIERPLLPIIGAEELFSHLSFQLSHFSSTLLTGRLGIGKTALARNLAYWHCKEHLAGVIYLQCRTLLSEEVRVPNIKDTIRRTFASAMWRARFGGRSLVVLDDLDWLCPAESELQIGNDNIRNKQVAESICTTVREYCSVNSRVVLLATAQSKNALHQVIIGGHVLNDIVSIKAPDKEIRRQILTHLLPSRVGPEMQNLSTRSSFPQGEPTSDHTKFKGLDLNITPQGCEPSKNFSISSDVDFLDFAGRCDGFMPGDLVLLASRARSEAIIRSINNFPEAGPCIPITISSQDISEAIHGFVPASLRNIPLQTSPVQWEDIGGLKATRQMLLETLQYPTTYAPIFASCPLRLRSGLLLYGYPGCGKTLLASAVAGECGLNFISVRGPEVLNKYIGASEKAIRDLFERAESAKPCVLFFDEFDSIAPKRGHDSTGVTDRVVNQLLTQMDGAEGLSGVYVLAATSRPDLIDPALLRPGRLDKSLLCGMPNMDDRVDILKVLCKKVRLDKTMLNENDNDGYHGYNVKHSIIEIALRSEGYSGADLQAVIYNAQLAAIHEALNMEQPNEKNAYGSVDRIFKLNDKKSEEQSPRSTYNFSYFRYDLGNEGEGRNSKTIQCAEVTERANIATQLESLHLQYRRRKVNIADNNRSVEINMHKNSGLRSNEPIIRWKHIEDSLHRTRPSIAELERGRLQQIYHQFIIGRNGDLPSGQGGTEIGGRMSLM